MVTVKAQIDAGWSASTLTLVALRDGVSLGTASATITAVQSVTLASITIDLSGAGAGVVDLVLRDATGNVAWTDSREVDAEGEWITATTETLRKLIEADEMLEEVSGVYVRRLYERGTTTQLVAQKVAKQPGGADLTNPVTQLLAGYREP